MRYARIVNQYKYHRQKRPDGPLWPGDGNIGDCIQSLAAENVYEKAGIAPGKLHYVNRDDIREYNGPKCRLLMQAWFADCCNVFPLPWSDNIEPIFVGFHLNTVNNTRQRFVKEKIHEKMKAYQPIGCRDRNTRDFLRELGLSAYFSGCLTLTFDRGDMPHPKNGKVFIVDLDIRAEKYIPKEIRAIADTSISHYYYFDSYPVSKQGAKEFEQAARDILNRYKAEAKMVITSKIHVAMPCIAFGIPVVFITTNPKCERFDVLNGIIPVYYYKDIKYINWNPVVPDIAELKSAIINNAVAQITGENCDECRQKLKIITDNLKPIRYLPKRVALFRKIKQGLKI